MIGSPSNDNQKKSRWMPLFLGQGLMLFLSLLILSGGLNKICWADFDGEVWYADQNTGIQNIINQASYGDTVYVRRGNYHEDSPIVVKEGISLIGVEESLGQVTITGSAGLPAMCALSNTIIRNLVIQGGEVGIVCPFTYKSNPVHDITIDHNLIIKNRAGIAVFSDQVTIDNNTIAHNKQGGVGIYLNPNGPVFNGEGNIIASNGSSRGIEFVQRDDPDCRLSSFLDISSVSLCYNNIYDDLYQVWYDCNNRVQEERIIPSPEIFGVENFSTDPFFIDANQNNYHLLSYSLCIDRADPNSDYSLEPQPNGGRANLGFYGNTPQAAPSEDFDEDGQYDHHEGVEDFDGDSLPDWQDADTAVIPLPWGKEKISLHLQDITHGSNQSIHLKDAQIKPFNEVVDTLPGGFIPYEAICFKVPDLPDDAVISVKIKFPQDYEALGVSEYLFLQAATSWQSLPFEIDSHERAITFTIEDGQSGDSDGENNGVLEHLGGLVIPFFDSRRPSQDCFISLIGLSFSPQPDFNLAFTTKDTVWLFFVLFLILFLGRPYFIPRFPADTTEPDKAPALYSSKKIMIILPALLFFLLFKASTTYAILFPDMEISSTPNPVGSGARALGLGGAFIAIGDDATAASWNPGALLKLKRPEFSLVGSFFSRGAAHHISGIEGDSKDLSADQWRLNYFSLAYPFLFLQRNMVFSLNYQHLYEFSHDTSCKWRYLVEDPALDIMKISRKWQKGGLNTLSPAMAVQIIPDLHVGLTANFWLNDELNNHWENCNIEKGAGMDQGDLVETTTKLYERYDFSGFNMHIGFWWQPNRRFTVGGVVKTPFRADIKRKYQYISIKEYPDNRSRNTYKEYSDVTDHSLYMPLSYGLGTSVRFSDSYLMALDIYHTRWQDYLLSYPRGEKISPINNKPKQEADIKPTLQVRLGAEYSVIGKRTIVPIRAGIFYDPEPAAGSVDDFYGFGLGTGIALKEFAFDIAYQYRFGHKKRGEYLLNKEIPTDIRQHYFYTSVIFYF